MANHDFDNNRPPRGEDGLPVDPPEYREDPELFDPDAPEPEYEAPLPADDFYEEPPRGEEPYDEIEEADREYEEYERHVRRGGRRDRERRRREREAERPTYRDDDEDTIGFSLRDVPRANRRRRRRYRDFGRGCLVGAMYVAFVLGVSMILASLVIIGANEVFAFVKPDRIAVVEIAEDATAAEVAEQLEEAGIIKYPMLFRLYCAVSDAEFKAGKYEISAALDYSAIARSLRYTSTLKETVRVTIPEGYQTAQIVDSLVENKVASAEDLYDAIQNYEFSHEFISGIGDSRIRLEGYLFPDTYEFYVDDSAPNVIAKFLTNFDIRFTQKLRDRAEELGLTINEVVTIASMIEREAKRDDERAIVASVIYNRLAYPERYPYLQIDATVQYVVGHAPTPEDLQVEDPYNTYVRKGLPPGPIANPGIASIEAALYPAKSSYFYYVARSDGTHIFSETLEEHEAAIREVSGE